MDHVNAADVEEVAEPQKAPAIPLGHPPPISYQDHFQRPPQYEQVDGNKVNPKAHYEGPQHNPYYDPLNDKTHAEVNRWSILRSSAFIAVDFGKRSFCLIHSMRVLEEHADLRKLTRVLDAPPLPPSYKT